MLEGRCRPRSFMTGAPSGTGETVNGTPCAQCPAMRLDPVGMILRYFDSVLPAFGGPPAAAVQLASAVTVHRGASADGRTKRSPRGSSSCGRTLGAPPPCHPALGGCGGRLRRAQDGSRVPRVRYRALHSGVEQRPPAGRMSLTSSRSSATRSGRGRGPPRPSCPRRCASGPIGNITHHVPGHFAGEIGPGPVKSGCRRD